MHLDCYYKFLLGLLLAEVSSYKFPDDFLFGVSSSAYQIEGAWNISDKTESAWDHMLHTGQFVIADGSNADEAIDSFHKYRRDIAILKHLGARFYRFSIAWTRLLPNGFADEISETGKDFYNNFIDELLANDIKPLITVFHFDLPNVFQDLGGWANPLLVDWYADYADVVFSLFADRVKDWITINEPQILCDFGYGMSLVVPALNNSGTADYLCSKNVLLAHAKAWRIFDQKYRPKYGGFCGITNHNFWIEPATNSTEDIDSVEDALDLMVGRFSHPIYTAEGGWPPRLEQKVGSRSAQQGFPRSRLPSFTEEEKALVRGTYDFYGLNHYTTWTARRLVKEHPGVDAFDDMDIEFSVDEADVEDPLLFWLKVHPPGMRKALIYIKETYDNPRVVICENGYGSVHKGLEDDKRIDYLKGYLQEVWKAIFLDGCNVSHYSVWSLTDSFEWASGFLAKFGLYEVDFPELRIRPRNSAFFYKHLISTNTLDLDHDTVYNSSNRIEF